MSNDRKSTFKAPPATLRDASTSQEQRRKKALEDQKRRRAERFDSSRQLDFFADLTLGPSDDEADEADPGQDAPEIVRDSLAQYAGLLPTPATIVGSSGSAVAPAGISESAVPPSQASDVQTNGTKRSKNKKKGKNAASAKSQKNRRPSKWADKCMYAELLEMIEDGDGLGPVHDGIPQDIETGWVAVTPVPVGKRCLAVTHQASGLAGVVPNMTLRSRVLGRPLMKPFPSPLPPQTVLDCILDENWRDNGILHVLDVIKWKGQDVADCETAFRFWWRDTRLSELPVFPPPPTASDPQAQPSATPHDASPLRYQFSHPSTFVPVPYHTDTSLVHLLEGLIPLTRSSRSVDVSAPLPASDGSTGMDLDGHAPSPLVQLETRSTEVKSDGLLLYVAQATYEPGTSPLSSWVPLRAYTEDTAHQKGGSIENKMEKESPLNVFEQLVRRRILVGTSSKSVIPEVIMEN